MDKVSLIEQFIGQCDAVIAEGDMEKAQLLVKKIVGVYGEEISRITQSLNAYSGIRVLGCPSRTQVNYLQDVDSLKLKLLNHKANIDAELRRKGSSDNKGVGHSINITNHNENRSSATAQASNRIEVSYYQVIERIAALPESVLSVEEKDELEMRLSAIEAAANGSDEDKLSARIFSVVKWIADKGIQVAMVAIPYLAEKIQLLQTRP